MDIRALPINDGDTKINQMRTQLKKKHEETDGKEEK